MSFKIKTFLILEDMVESKSDITFPNTIKLNAEITLTVVKLTSSTTNHPTTTFKLSGFPVPEGRSTGQKQQLNFGVAISILTGLMMLLNHFLK